MVVFCMIIKDFYSVKEVAKILDYSEKTIRDYIRKGIFKSEQIKKWGRHRIPWLEIPSYGRKRMLKVN